MRTGHAPIWDLWNSGGPAVGVNAPNAIVTVEKDWQLSTSAGDVVGTFVNGPIRWWQRADNSQVETVIPNVEHIQWDRSLDQDAATCTITLSNQWHLVNGEVALNDGELGQPGYFTFSRGESSDAQTRWGHATNEWNEVLVPDALLRLYEGYGGKNKTPTEATGDGNLALTGVWLIDEVNLSARGKVELHCRDMAKLLVEQQAYPPLVPAVQYPVKFCRWGYRDLSSSDTLLVTSADLDVIPAEQTSPIQIAGTTEYAGAVPYPEFPIYEGNEPGNGYWSLTSDGHVYAFGNNEYYGDVYGIADWETNPAQMIEATLTGKGYWIILRNGAVHAFGDAVNYGSPSPFAETVSMARHYHGRGYWTIGLDGVVIGFGEAVAMGNVHADLGPGFPNWTIGVDIAADPVGNGYWVLNSDGTVSAYGSAVHHGEPYGSTFMGSPTPVRTHIRIVAHPDGGGYWVIDQVGQTYAYGTAVHYGQLAGQAYAAFGGGLPFDNPNFPDFMCDLVPTPSGNGYWLYGVSGGIYPFGDAIHYGALNGPYEAWLGREGNYKDYIDVVKTLLLWSGFWLFDDVDSTEAPKVFGNLEATGAYASDCLPDDMFDKHPIIDPITKIKEIVGYIFWVDEEGAVHFESPNIYQPGNFDEFGLHLEDIPNIDEAIQLTEYGVQFTDRSARSEIIISTADPTDDLDDTLTTRYTPATSDILRGIVKPGMWVNGVFTSAYEQEIMAELIGLYSWLAQRQGSVTMMANPCIQINDQVRIWERVTSETYIHYVRGISSDLDLVSGTYYMTLTTHWMGDESVWAIDLGLAPYTFEDVDPAIMTYRFSTSELQE